MSAGVFAILVNVFTSLVGRLLARLTIYQRVTAEDSAIARLLQLRIAVATLGEQDGW